MGHQIIKQPDGRYASWSSIVSDFVILDATPEQIIAIRVEEARVEITRKVGEVVGKLEKGEASYYQFTKTWDEACAWAKEVHGPDWKPGNMGRLD